MVSPEYYQVIYLFIIFVCTTYTLQKYNIQQNDNTICIDNSRSTLILSLFFTLYIGLRPTHITFVDMVDYARKIDFLKIANYDYTWNSENKIFDNLINYIAKAGWNKSAFFLLIAAIYYIGTFLAIKKFFPNNSFITDLVWLGAFSTFSYGVNGIKAGAAASLFLIAVAYYERRIIAVVFLLLSLGFHHSMILPVGAFVLAYFYRNTKVYLAGWCFCLLIAMLHISFFQNLLAGFADKRGSEYLLSSGENWGGRSGFRFDFVLYSAMPVWVGYWAIFRKRVASVTYEFLLSIYLITNGVWMLCMYANFTNRIAYLSWCIYPIVLIFPFLKEDLGKDKYRMFTMVASLHLLFTLFMFIVYY